MADKLKRLSRIISLGLSVACIIQTAHRYLNYNTAINSLSFKDWAIINSIFYIVPIIIILAIGSTYDYIKRKSNSRKTEERDSRK